MVDYVPESAYAETMWSTVRPYLEARKSEGRLESFDGSKLYYAIYTCDNPVRSMVILHGFTESVEKFAELSYYFMQTGCNIYLLEQRGHGRSDRSVDDLTLTHVAHFEDYVRDLEIFMEQVVPRDKPRCVYAHSMGGAVATWYMEKYPFDFDKAILSAPMIAPQRGGFPLWAAKLACMVPIGLGKSKKRTFISGEYPGHEEFQNSFATSQARFDDYESLRTATPVFQNYSPTYRWTLEALRVTRKILKRGAPEGIQTEVLLLQGELDNVVVPEAQQKLIDRLPHGTLQKVMGAKHEIYRSHDAVLQPVVEQMLAFLQTGARTDKGL